MDQGRNLIRLAVFGRPVKTSLSPRIHRMFASQFGLDIDYQSIETGVGGFPGALESFRRAGGTGCNITLPLKRKAWQLAAGSSSEVSRAQAANTLVYQRSAGWVAHTTDGAGLVADLTSNHGIELSGQRIVILGAGGAAAGILGSILAGEPGQVVLVNRDLDRARALAERFDDTADVLVSSWTELTTLGHFDLLINATSLGHQDEAPPLSASVFAPGSCCYDLNYHRASGPLKALCKEMGQAYIDGLGMLVEQAAVSFYIWTGNKPETQSVIESLREEVDQL